MLVKGFVIFIPLLALPESFFSNTKGAGQKSDD